MKKNELKFIFSKWYFNYYELEEIKELLKEYNLNFNKELDINYNDLIDKNILNEIKFNNENKKTESVLYNDKIDDNFLDKDENKFIKKITKKIKLICHPDKTKNKDLNEIIKDINDAEKNEDYSYILLCAYELNIKDLYSNILIIEKIFKKFYNIKLKKEAEIKSSYIWCWGNSNLEQKKYYIEILKKYISLVELKK
jgi:hypothetical protein